MLSSLPCFPLFCCTAIPTSCNIFVFLHLHSSQHSINSEYLCSKFIIFHCVAILQPATGVVQVCQGNTCFSRRYLIWEDEKHPGIRALQSGLSQNADSPQHPRYDSPEAREHRETATQDQLLPGRSPRSWEQAGTAHWKQGREQEGSRPVPQCKWRGIIYSRAHQRRLL